MTQNQNGQKPSSTFLSSLYEFIRKTIRKHSLFVLHLSPYQNLTYNLFLYTAIAWAVLSLPFMTRESLSAIDNLFTAAAAVSTSGFTSVNFAESYTLPGKIIILAIVQFFALGFMTITSFMHLSLSQRITYKRKEVLNAEFSLPNTIHLKDFLRTMIVFTVLIESAGAIFLFNYFHNTGQDTLTSLWWGVFHSVSAFCTAGFSLFPGNIEPFANSRTVNAVLSILSLAGSIGFIVVTDLFNRIMRKTRKISYTSKVIALSTLIFLTLGTLMMYFTNDIKLHIAFFQAMSALSTAGFNSIAVNTLSMSSALIMVALMCIGASPSGTGGGMKTTTVAAALALVYSRLRGNKHVVFFGKRIPISRLYMATSSFIFYIMILFGSLFLLTLTETMPFRELLFEAASALSTTGLTTGITPLLTPLGKLVLIMTMLIGRVGVVTFGMSFLSGRNHKEIFYEKEDLAL